MQQRRPADLDLTRIVEAHGGRVRRVLRARGVAERDLPDAEQEVFLVVHRKLAEFEGRSSLGTWLHRIAANVASEHRRKARHRYESLADATALDASASDPHAKLEARDGLVHVGAALDALSAEQRDALLLHDVAGLSTHEVAAQLGVPLKTAFSRLYAARRSLAAALGRRGIAVSALWTWLSMLTPSRWLSRAKASAAQLQLATVALACSVLPPLALTSAGPSNEQVAPVQARTTAATNAAPRSAHAPGESATFAAHALAPSNAARPARSTRRARSEAYPAAARISRTSRTSAPIEPEPSHATETAFSESDELIVTRSGVRDVRPQLANPLSGRIGVSAPPQVRMRFP